MFYSKKPFILFAVVAGILFSPDIASSAKSSAPKIETENFVLYFESVKDDAYQDRDKIAQTIETVYEKISRRTDMKRDEKIPVYFVDALLDDRAHGYAKVSMTKGGSVGIYLCYFPLTTWRGGGEFGFIKSLIPEVERRLEEVLEEEIIKALFVRKYLEPQKEPRKFNTYLYEFASSLTSFYSHFGISWLLNNPSVDETLPVSGILANKFDDIRALNKTISFCGFLVENYGFDAFERLLKNADYENANTLIGKIYKKDTDALEKEWRAWLKKKFGANPRLFDEDKYRQRYNEISRLYLFGSKIASAPLRKYLLDAAAVHQALLDIGCSDEEKFASAKKLSEKRRKYVIKKDGFCEVSFYLRNKNAKTVSIAADFNKWNHQAPFNEMTLADEAQGLWRATVYLKPGKYQYKFVIDGNTWVADEKSDGYFPDGFGGQNSVLVIDEKVRKRVVGSM